MDYGMTGWVEKRIQMTGVRSYCISEDCRQQFFGKGPENKNESDRRSAL